MPTCKNWTEAGNLDAVLKWCLFFHAIINVISFRDSTQEDWRWCNKEMEIRGCRQWSWWSEEAPWPFSRAVHSSPGKTLRRAVCLSLLRKASKEVPGGSHAWLGFAGLIVVSHQPGLEQSCLSPKCGGEKKKRSCVSFPLQKSTVGWSGLRTDRLPRSRFYSRARSKA